MSRTVKRVLYEGPPYRKDGVVIGPVTAARVHAARIDTVAAVAAGWVDRAVGDTGVMYFGIYVDDRLVGDVFLHDRDTARGEALVGYHLFQEADRNKGIGTTALRLLLDYIRSEEPIRRAVIITSADNPPSQRLAEKCGFRYAGSPEDDPDSLLYEWLRYPPKGDRPPGN